MYLLQYQFKSYHLNIYRGITRPRRTNNQSCLIVKGAVWCLLKTKRFLKNFCVNVLILIQICLKCMNGNQTKNR